MSVRPAGVVLGAFLLALVGVAWVACKSSSAGSSSAGDDGGDGASDAFQLPEGPGCNPCLAVCECTPGDMYFSPGNCMTVTCGPSGTWGGGGCIGLGCMDATDDGEAGETDATTEASTDASAEGAADGGAEAAIDAPADVATEGSSD